MGEGETGEDEFTNMAKMSPWDVVADVGNKGKDSEDTYLEALEKYDDQKLGSEGGS